MTSVSPSLELVSESSASLYSPGESLDLKQCVRADCFSKRSRRREHNFELCCKGNL